MKQDKAIKYLLEIGEIEVDLENGAVITDLTQRVSNSGYVFLQKKIKGVNHAIAVHRVIAYVLWGDQILDYEINHIDGNKLNNHPSNLELVTHAENMQHAADNGLAPKGEDHCNAKLSNEQVAQIRYMYSSGNYIQSKLAWLFNVTQQSISYIVRQETRK